VSTSSSRRQNTIHDSMTCNDDKNTSIKTTTTVRRSYENSDNDNDDDDDNNKGEFLRTVLTLVVKKKINVYNVFNGYINCQSVKYVAEKRIRSFIEKYSASLNILCKLFI